MKRRITIMVGAFILLNIIDAVLTIHAVKAEGAIELNRFMAWLLTLPLGYLLLIKIGGSALIGGALLFAPGKWWKRKLDILWATNSIMVIVVTIGVVTTIIS